MLKKDPNAESYYHSGIWGKVTLDGLLRKAVQAHTDAIAVQDPPDRQNWTDGTPQNWSWVKLNAAVEQLSHVIACWKLPPNARVIIQLPNIAEQILAYCACLRAECIPVIAEAIAGPYELRSLGARVDASAVITLTRFGAMRPAEQARDSALYIPSLRFLAAFGDNCPDGVLSLTEILTHPSGNVMAVSPVRALPFGTEDKIAHACPVILDDQLQLVIKSHNHLLAGGMMTYLESQANPQEAIICTIPVLSAGGMNAVVVPWLLSQSTLILHQPFTADVLMSQVMGNATCRVVIPGRQMDLLQSLHLPVQAITCVWSNAAEYTQRIQAQPAVAEASDAGITDLVMFNAVGGCALRRDSLNCKPIALGSHTAPRKVQGSPGFITIDVVEVLDQLHLHCTGPSVGEVYKLEEGMPNTGFTCTLNSQNEVQALQHTSRIAYIGGLAVSCADIEAEFADHAVIDRISVQAIPDPIFGNRLKLLVSPRTHSLPKARLLTLVEKHMMECGFSTYKSGAEIDIVAEDMHMHAANEAVQQYRAS